MTAADTIAAPATPPATVPSASSVSAVPQPAPSLRRWRLRAAARARPPCAPSATPAARRSTAASCSGCPGPGPTRARTRSSSTATAALPWSTPCSRALELGARPARTGEFTERAFVNGRLDLAQAEAEADLIASADAAGARAAVRSLEGAFSARIGAQVEELTALRAWIEAAPDFPDDDVDPLADAALRARVAGLADQLAETHARAGEGRRLVEGVGVVIAGAPNAGKSSLLNRLAGADAAIVTEVPGTTRDVLRESVRIGGVPVTLVDTAGLCDTDDPIETEGVRRARRALAGADRVLCVVDASRPAPAARPEAAGTVIDWVRNKIDITGEAPGVAAGPDGTVFRLSATTGAGVEAFRTHLGRVLASAPEAGVFSARPRHLEALDHALAQVKAARTALEASAAGELAAEHLRSAQHALGTITGATTTEDLLGEIFARFCIGK